MKNLLIIWLSISGFTILQAQESLNTTGGNATGTAGSVSYSIGQIAYKTHTGTNSTLAEGIQQPIEVSEATAIGEFPGMNISISAYPNPTHDLLMLEINTDFLSLSYELCNLQGNLLFKEKIIDSKTTIVVATLIPSIYFLKVMQGNKEIKTFKIIIK
jgi:hypothetical protein